MGKPGRREQLSRGRDANDHVSQSLGHANRWKNCRHGVLGAARRGRSVSGVCDQLRPPWVPCPLVRAVWPFYVSLSWWRVLPRRFTRVWAAGAWALRISIQNRKRSAHDQRWSTANSWRPGGKSDFGEAAMRVIKNIGEWFDHRLQLAAPIREAVEHPVPRNPARW